MSQAIGRYEIKSKLGEGGMADVYAAHDPNFDRDVVVKVIKREFSSFSDFRARFHREAKVIAGLEHEAIVPVYDFGEHDGQPFIVMRHMTGGTLADRLANGPLSLLEVAPIVERIADALDHAHSRGIIHRDLKPGNILFDSRGKAFLSDFGIAKLAEATTKLTGSAIIGTPAYMSPEQARSVDELDRRSDVYSLGVVIFELLTGELPFKAREPMGMALAHLSEPVPDVRKSRPDLPRESDTVIRRAMAKKPNDRYQTTGELSADLSKIATRPSLKRREAVPPKVEKIPTPPKGSSTPATPPTAGDSRLTGDLTLAAETSRRSGVPRWLLWAAPIALVGLCILVVLVGGILAVPGILARLTPTPNNVAALSTSTTLPILAPQATATSTKPIATSTEAPTPARACSAPTQFNAASAPSTQSVTLAFSQEPDIVNGLFSYLFQSYWTAQLTQAGLAKWDAKNDLVPDLAEAIPSIENGGLSADGLIVTWHLKKCLYWSDGEPITSADVKFTWQAIVDSSNTPIDRTGYDKIASVTTPDDYTVTLNFSDLYPGWPRLFTQGNSYSGAILPKHILQGHRNLESDPEIRQPTVSSGPFVIRDWVAGDHLTLVANPNYVSGRPNLDAVIIRFIPDLGVALTALQAGEIDFYPDFTETDLAAIGASEPSVHLRAMESGDFEHYFFNLGTTAGVAGQGKSDRNGFCPFQDVRVRKAIMSGIDRQSLVKTFLAGQTSVPASIWPNSPWYNTSLQPYPYDPDQAKQLLEEAGYRTGSDGIRAGQCKSATVKLSFNFETTPRQLRVDMAAAVKTMLSEIGVEFNPIHTVAGTFFGSYADGANLPTGSFDMAGYTNGFYPDPFTDNFLCSAVPNKNNPSGSNFYHLCDPQLDALFAQLNASADPVQRKQTMDEIQRYQYDNVLFIPMYARLNVYAYSANFDLGPSGGYAGWAWNAVAWDVNK